MPLAAGGALELAPACETLCRLGAGRTIPCVAVAKGVVRLQVSCVLLPTYIMFRLLGLNLFEPKQGTAAPRCREQTMRGTWRPRHTQKSARPQETCSVGRC